MKNKLWIFCCTFVVMLFAMGATEVNAAKADDEWNYESEVKVTMGGFTYNAITSLDEKEIWIYEINVNTKNNDCQELNIPKMLDNKIVTRIGYTVKKSPCEEGYNHTIFGGCEENLYGVGAGAITNITIPETVEIIQPMTFCAAYAITSITIPPKVKIIEEETFGECWNLKTVNLPSDLKKIGKKAFAECPKLKNLSLSAKNKTYKIKDKCVIRKKDKALLYVLPKKGTLKIPDGVKIIEEYAFCNCTSSEIHIPASVIHIEDYAFEPLEQQLYYDVKNITVSKKNKIYGNDGQCIYNKKNKTLVIAVVDDKGNLVVSDKVKYLKNTYSIVNYNPYLDELKKVVLPEGLKKIEAYSLERLCAADKVYFKGEIPPTIKKKKGGSVSLPCHVYVPKNSYNAYKKWYKKYNKNNKCVTLYTY
ncbi:MAG: leucine-rich repeat domain-containing protein [Lachnospiraceae bacterium]|nr:leucine-rich repeat domain-containing protein [Lachnospiraceae bacterium]